MSSVKLDSALFQKRIKEFLKTWKADSEAFGNAEVALIPSGEANEETVYQKGTAIQTWLFQFEFPDTVLVICKDFKVYVLCSQKKANILNGLNDSAAGPGDKKVTVVTFPRSSKDPEMSKDSIDRFSEELKKYDRFGIFSKDKISGKWASEWGEIYAKIKEDGGKQEVDMTHGVATVLAVKDELEVKTTRQAGKVSSLVMKNYFVDEMATIIDEERSISHEQFSEKIENILYDEKARRRLQIPSDVSPEYLDFCYTPIVQSGGKYDLKPSAASNSESLHAGVITASLGVRYRNYCSNVGRTYMIDPTKKQQEYYAFMLDLQKFLMENIKDGVVCQDIFGKAQSYISENQPELSSHFTKNIGFVTGLEFRESTYVINAKNSRPLREGMSVNLAFGFAGLENTKAEDEHGQTYALFLADTVIVGATAASYLTEAPREFRAVSFFFKDDEAEAAPKKASPAKVKSSAILKTKLRAEARSEENAVAEQRRKEHQMQLLEGRIEEGLNRHAEESGKDGKEPKQTFKRYESYKAGQVLPSQIRSGKILIDRRSETVLLPIMGISVPFHVNTIKNVTKSEEGNVTYLRFNFATPAQGGKKDESLPYDDPSATFVRSLSYRSSDTNRYNDIYKQVNELKKAVQKKEAERKLKADLVEQEDVVEGKRPFGILAEVSVRPSLEGKKLPGDLQIHSNGLRYQPLRGDQRVDIPFSNIKHLFLQPCDHELYVILHCHLKHPIMVGKKKTTDIQVYRDVSEGGFDETSNRRGRRQYYNDEDELIAEQEERRKKQKMNREFKQFAEKIVEVSNILECDVPIRELGFTGVPSRTSVLLQPTTECLIHITDPPFTVITLADVEIAYLERVQFHLRNFDMVFVMKDFSIAPQMINSIPMKQLEPIKEWLDSVDIPYLEGPLNLNWANIMKNINQDPAGFYEDGGWTTMVKGEEEEEGFDEEEEEESEYEQSDDDEEEEEEEEESDFEEEEEDESEEFDEEEDESEGDDWDVLEKKAKRADDKRRSQYEEDADIRPKKKRK